MKAIYFSLLGVGTLCATAPAQDLDDPALPRQRFGFSVPTWIKAGARFTGARATDPGATPSTPATLADGRVNRTYDDGFNRVNSVGNPVLVGAPRTSFFEYDNQSQVTATTLALHSVALNGGDYTRKLDNQPVPGLEMFFHRDWLGGKRWQLGWEFGASYALFQWRQNGSPNSSVNLLTDQFNLNGVPLSSPGVAGPYTPVPGVTYIGSTPTRTEAIVPASVTGTRQLLGSGQAGRAAADHGHCLAGLLRRGLRLHPALGPGAVDDGVLDRLDAHRVVVHRASEGVPLPAPRRVAPDDLCVIGNREALQPAVVLVGHRRLHRLGDRLLPEQVRAAVHRVLQRPGKAPRLEPRKVHLQPRAIAFPSPLLPPVISATLPVKSNRGDVIVVVSRIVKIERIARPPTGC